MKEAVRRKCYIVSYSGGIGSFYAAFRLKYEWKITDEIQLVFTDTLIEDEDLYRFLIESARLLELPLVWLADGRTPWEVFRDVKYQGNTRKAPCSRVLKRVVMARYMAELQRLNPHVEYILVLGIDVQEAERLETAKINNPLYQVIAPMCEKPYQGRDDYVQLVELFGMELPRLYKMGFSHNNCGGFCVRAGLAQFALLREKMPERYETHANAQKKLVEQNPDLDKPFLRKTMDGDRGYITLEDYGKILDKEGLADADKNDHGGCACFVDDGDEVVA